MPSIDYDLLYLQSGLLDLQGYLLSRELFWPIGASAPPGEPPFPRMTLGNLLLSHRRLQAQPLSENQRAEYERLSQRLEGTRKEWRVAWGQKAQREVSTRLGLWRDFIEDYRKKPQANADRYTYEVSRRVVIELLLPEAESIPSEEQELLNGMDGMLRAVLEKRPFIWDENLEPAFPQDRYWFLYGVPKSDDPGSSQGS
jgi:hypothetical protein